MDRPVTDSNSSPVSSSMEKIQRISQGTPSFSPSDCPNLSAKVGEIQDPSLNHLRKKINDVMLPFLTTVFELKQDFQNAQLPSSRIARHQTDVKDIHTQLASLSSDLEILMSWCEGSQKQIQKILKQIDPQADTPPPPAVKKSFWLKIGMAKIWPFNFACNRKRSLR